MTYTQFLMCVIGIHINTEKYIFFKIWNDIIVPLT